MTELTSLIERLEKAEGPSRDLDAAIFDAIPPTTDAPYPPEFTSSIDAAVSLAERVLPGRSIMMGWRQSSETRPWARVGLWADPDATGATPAIALVLATLRALQSRGEA